MALPKRTFSNNSGSWNFSPEFSSRWIKKRDRYETIGNVLHRSVFVVRRDGGRRRTETQVDCAASSDRRSGICGEMRRAGESRRRKKRSEKSNADSRHSDCANGWAVRIRGLSDASGIPHEQGLSSGNPYRITGCAVEHGVFKRKTNGSREMGKTGI